VERISGTHVYSALATTDSSGRRDWISTASVGGRSTRRYGSIAGTADRIAVLYQGELVEVGAARDVITRPQHVYTRLLVSSAPTLRTSPVGRAEREALRALLNVPARLIRHARRRLLRLPADHPHAGDLTHVWQKIRALPT